MVDHRRYVAALSLLFSGCATDPGPNIGPSLTPEEFGCIWSAPLDETLPVDPQVQEILDRCLSQTI